MSTRHPRPRLGISSCLLGSNVRYDGGNKRNEFLLKTLGPYVDWVTVCPEVDIGLGTPRPPIELVRGAAGGIRLVMPVTGEDLTERMTSYSQRRVATLHAEQLSGYVLKSKSPSCGMERVPVHDEGGDAPEVGAGLFAAVLQQRMPQLPVEEEGRLEDPHVRENFVTRIFSRARWMDREEGGSTMCGLVGFHARHRYLLMSRDPSMVRILDLLLGQADDGRADLSELAVDYERRFSQALSRIPSRESRGKVMQSMADSELDGVSTEDRVRLQEALDRYRARVVSCAVPVAVLRELVRKNDIKALAEDVYLEPHTDELKLLHHV